MSEQIDAGAELVRRLDKLMPVTAAFWLKPSIEGRWYLYIASTTIQDGDLRPAYGEILRLTREMQNPYADPFRVKLIPADHPLARDVQELRQRYPGPLPIRFDGPILGDLGVEDTYIYPATAVVPA